MNEVLKYQWGMDRINGVGGQFRQVDTSEMVALFRGIRS